MLNIIICIKAIPYTLIGKKERSEQSLGINPYDMYALNKLIELKKKVDCKITCLCMGKLDAKDLLIHCKAMGADEAILLSDIAFAGADTYATTYTLEKAIKKLPYDLIVCGAQAVDGETGQVPFGLAKRLNTLCISNVEEIEDLCESSIRIQYNEENMRKTVSAKLPLVAVYNNFTIKVGKVNLLQLKRAQRTPIQVWNAADLQAEPEMLGQKGSLTKVYSSVGVGNKARNTSYVDGTGEEVSRWLTGMIQKYEG